MPKTLEQLREQFYNHYGFDPNEEDKKDFRVRLDWIADYWLSIIQAEREEFEKTLNSGRKMYELGKKEAREELRSKVKKKEVKVQHDNPILEAQCTAYNQALKDILYHLNNR